ncbi:MAG: hypothetical protein ACTSVI_04130 [Promethearchaeota archaeon]
MQKCDFQDENYCPSSGVLLFHDTPHVKHRVKYTFPTRKLKESFSLQKSVKNKE